MASGHEYLAGQGLAQSYSGTFDVDDEISAVFGNDGDGAAGDEAEAFQKAPGVVPAVNFINAAKIADVEHGEWHGVCMNQIRKKVSLIKQQVNDIMRLFWG